MNLSIWNQRGAVTAAVLIIANSILLHCMAASPDPVVLLQGVEQARLQIPASRLHIQATYSNSLASRTREFIVEFDQNKRRYVDKNAKVRSLFDGSRAICFDGDKSVTIRDTSNVNAEYLFDPRVLGITATYAWNETLETTLPHRTSSTIELIGKESINGQPTWHVYLVDNFNQKKHIWIDSENGFRVLRYDCSVTGQTNSTYAYYENPAYPWLPSRVSTVCRAGSTGSILDGYNISIVKAESKVTLSDEIWTIAGVEPQIGSAVSDLRTKVRIGYWNGQGLSQDSDLAVIPEPPKHPKLIITVLLTTMIAGPMLFWFYRSSRTKRPANDQAVH